MIVCGCCSSITNKISKYLKKKEQEPNIAPNILTVSEQVDNIITMPVATPGNDLINFSDDSNSLLQNPQLSFGIYENIPSRPAVPKPKITENDLFPKPAPKQRTTINRNQPTISALDDLDKIRFNDAQYMTKKATGTKTVKVENPTAVASTSKPTASTNEGLIQIQINNDDTGYSYARIFEPYLTNTIKSVTIYEPYLLAYHQIQNLVRFIELLVDKCSNLRTVLVITKRSPKDEQSEWLDDLEDDLICNFNIALIIKFSETIHDRKIELDNGWVVKIGRGLHYFKAPRSKVCIGFHDMNFRRCMETTVDIFLKSNVFEVTN